jgi:hypothetical protein
MKLPVPNICAASGVSCDYRLAYGNLNNYLERIENGESARTRFLAMRSFLNRAIPKYQEYFDPEKYVDVVTPRNETVVTRINELVERLNELRINEVTEFDILAPLRAALEAAIAGQNASDDAGA